MPPSFPRRALHSELAHQQVSFRAMIHSIITGDGKINVQTTQFGDRISALQGFPNV